MYEGHEVHQDREDHLAHTWALQVQEVRAAVAKGVSTIMRNPFVLHRRASDVC